MHRESRPLAFPALDLVEQRVSVQLHRLLAEGEPVLGVGLRTFLADDDAVTLLEWRQLQVSAGGA